jgi:competence protein ComEC
VLPTRSEPASPAPEEPGRHLLLLCLGAGSGVVAGNLLSPGWPWLGALVPLALLSMWRGLRERPQPLAWCGAGLLLGLASCAVAPRCPLGESRLAVRFRAEVRDGWRQTQMGYQTRVRLTEVEHQGRALRHHRDVALVMGGERLPRGLPRPGDRVEGSGELVFDPSWPLHRPILRVKSTLLLRVMSAGSPVDRLRESVVQALQTAAGVDAERIRASGLAAALVLGRRELLPPGEVASLRRSGLAHLLAVSGLHVGMVSAIVWAVLLLAGVGPSGRRWAVMVSLVGFALLAGGAAPVRRASLSGVLYLGMRQVGRPLLAFPAVAAVVTTLLLLEPSAMFEVSFQLSALVTLALVRWVPDVSRGLSWLLGRSAPVVAVALVAQAASVPLVGMTFGSVAVAGVVANLVAVPVGFAAVVASLGACVASCLGRGLGGAVLASVGFVQAILDRIAAAGGRLDMVFPPLPTLLVVFLVLGGLLALGWMRRAWVAALAGVAAVVCWMAWPGLPADSHYRVKMLPVADGMAILVSAPKSSVLIDGGRSARGALDALAALRVRSLAAVLVTHPDADHTGGLLAVLKGRRVGALVYPASEECRQEIVELRRVARERGTKEVAATAGQRLRFGELVTDVLWPPLRVTGRDNDRSLVTAVTAGGVRVLLTGDLEATGERALLASRRGPLSAAVLQLPHHGSATSSTAPFLQAVDATVALVASGLRPRYRYPAEATVRRVRLAGAVLVPQVEGLDTVTWRRGGRLTIDSPLPVSVSPCRGKEP